MFFFFNEWQQQQEPREGAGARADGQSVPPPAGHCLELFCATSLPWAALVKPSQLRERDAKGGHCFAHVMPRNNKLLCNFPNSATPFSCCNLHVACRFNALLGLSGASSALHSNPEKVMAHQKQWNSPVFTKKYVSQMLWATSATYSNYLWFEIIKCLLRKKIILADTSLSLGSYWNSLPAPALTFTAGAQSSAWHPAIKIPFTSDRSNGSGPQLKRHQLLLLRLQGTFSLSHLFQAIKALCYLALKETSQIWRGKVEWETTPAFLSFLTAAPSQVSMAH